jgi:histone acetyltransferase (RNA polymerase elongator complex component)
MTQLETRLIGTAPKRYDLKMSRTTKNYLAGLDLAERVRTVEFIKTLPKRHQDKIQDFLENSPHRHTMMMYILAADEA